MRGGRLYLSTRCISYLYYLGFPHISVPYFITRFPSYLFITSSRECSVVYGLRLSFLLFLPFLGKWVDIGVSGVSLWGIVLNWGLS